jgi:predicted Zn-dependent protease
MEREADRIGLGVLTQAGFEGQGFVTMFEKLQQSSRLNDNGAFPYLRTHPLTLERIVDMRSRQPLGERVAPQRPDLEHALMAARARALSTGGVELHQALVREALFSLQIMKRVNLESALRCQWGEQSEWRRMQSLSHPSITAMQKFPNA